MYSWIQKKELRMTTTFLEREKSVENPSESQIERLKGVCVLRKESEEVHW